MFLNRMANTFLEGEKNIYILKTLKLKPTKTTTHIS